MVDPVPESGTHPKRHGGDGMSTLPSLLDDRPVCLPTLYSTADDGESGEMVERRRKTVQDNSLQNHAQTHLSAYHVAEAVGSSLPCRKKDETATISQRRRCERALPTKWRSQKLACRTTAMSNDIRDTTISTQILSEPVPDSSLDRAISPLPQIPSSLQAGRPAEGALLLSDSSRILVSLVLSCVCSSSAIRAVVRGTRNDPTAATVLDHIYEAAGSHWWTCWSGSKI